MNYNGSYEEKNKSYEKKNIYIYISKLKKDSQSIK